MRKPAFTLAELMISLVAFGLIAGIVYPAIMHLKPDRTKILIKHAYYKAETVVAELSNDPVLYPPGTPFGNAFPGQFESKFNIQTDNNLSDKKFTGADGIEWDLTGCSFPGACSVQVDVKTGKPAAVFKIKIEPTGKMSIDPAYPEAIKAVQMAVYK